MHTPNFRRALARRVVPTFATTAAGARARAFADVHLWKKHKDAYKAARYKATHGFVAAARCRTGSLRPWNFGAAAAVLMSASYADGRTPVPGRRVVELMGWLLGTEHTMRRKGLRATHAHLATLLGCSERTAGSTLRAAVAAGMVERQPWFIPRQDGRSTARGGGKAHDQRECCYQVTAQFREFLKHVKKRGVTASLLAGKSCQPAELQFSTKTRKVSPAGTKNCTTLARPVDNHGASSMAAPAAQQLRREAEQASCRAALPADIASAVEPDILPEASAAWASFNRRFGDGNN